MSERDTLSIIAEELGSALEPLATALSDPDSFNSFMLDLGWNLNSAPQAIANLGTPLGKVVNTLAAGEIDSSKASVLIEAVKALIAAIKALKSTLSGPLPVGFANEFPEQLIRYLIVEYLVNRHPGWGEMLRAMGAIRIEEVAAAGGRPAYTRREIAWDLIPQLLDDPLVIFKDAYHWGQNDFRGQLLLDNISRLAEGWGLPHKLDRPEQKLLDYLNKNAVGATELNQFALRIPFIEDLWSEARTEAGVGLFILPATATEKPGFAILPYARGSLDLEIPLTDSISLVFEGKADFTGGVGLIARPSKPVEMKVDLLTAGAPPSAAGLSIALINHPASGAAKLVILGSTTGSRFEATAISIKLGGRLDSAGKNDLFIEFELTDARIVIDPGSGDADSFLTSLLPSGGFNIDFSLLLGISLSQGFYFGGSGGLEVSLPAHIQLGPIEIMSALLAVKVQNGQVPVDLAGTIKGDLGVLKAVVENIGLRATFAFPPGGNGNLGPLDVGLGFRPPNGVGLTVDAGVVKGGGYLYIDTDKGEYAGALELVFSGFINLKAIGIINTKMPDGSGGFSLLMIVTAEFGTGIQLGFGFTLLAVGGLLGLNRTMKLQPLMDGVRTGSINSIMFPKDVVANAPRIISDLRTIFPPASSRFLIGPMAQLGWGTPTLISLALGIIIEIPGNIAILGVLRVALPADEAALLVIQVNFAGAIEFDKKRLYFFASLFESRVLFITIEGEMGVLAAFGDDANFVVSVGGFHPRFDPPPLPFPVPKRIAVNILNEDWGRIRVMGYFAVTSNTVQFGAHAELFFGFSALSIEGHIGFDALFQFSPFFFIVEISAGVSLKVFGAGIFSIDLRFSLEGPTPWRARGTGSITILFFEVSADFDVSWGESRNTSLPPIEVLPVLAAEFNKLENWQARLAKGSNLLVSLRKLDSGVDALVLHPVGVLRISQKAVPLDLTLDKVGSQKPTDATKFALNVSGGAGLAKKADALEQFAPAQFQNMDDSAKLSRPAYQKQHGGVELSVSGRQVNSSRADKRVVRYEQIIIDSNYKRFVRRFVPYVGALFTHFLRGAAVAKSPLSAAVKKQLQPFEEKIQVRQQGYVVASQATNKAYAPGAVFASEALAREHLSQRIAEDPNLADELHILPETEVAA